MNSVFQRDNSLFLRLCSCTHLAFGELFLFHAIFNLDVSGGAPRGNLIYAEFYNDRDVQKKSRRWICAFQCSKKSLICFLFFFLEARM